MSLPVFKRSRRPVSIGLILAVAVIAIACSPAGASPSPTGAGREVNATLSEWQIDVSAASAPAGTVVFNIANQGTTVHEFLVIRTDMMAADMPVKDHMIDIAAMGGPMATGGMGMPGMSPSGDMTHPVGTVGLVESIPAGGTERLTLDNMQAGHYALVCNIATHYEQGMRVDFSVGP